LIILTLVCSSLTSIVVCSVFFVLSSFCSLFFLFISYQQYNLKKKLENAYKSRREKRKGKDPEAISAVGSAVYARRFEKYIESLVA